MGSQCLSALSEITTALKSENPSTVRRALTVLDNLARSGPTRCPRSFVYSIAQNKEIRSDAANILPTFGKEAKVAIPKLQEMAKSDDFDVRCDGKNGLELIERFVE